MPTKSPMDMIAAGPNTIDGTPRASEFEPIAVATPAEPAAPASPTTPPVAADAEAHPDPTPPAPGEATVGDALAAFDKLISKPHSDGLDKPAPAKAVQPPAPPAKPNDTTPANPDTSLPPTAKRPTQQPTASGDDSQLVPEPIFKQMSNTAKEWAIAQAKQVRDLTASNKQATEALAKQKDGALPDSWYEHPHAYALVPEFQQGQYALNDYQGKLAHYQKQLIAIKEGEKWQDLVQMKDGSIRVEEREPSARADALVMDRISTAKTLIAEEERHLQGMVQEYTARHKEVKTVLSGLENKYFPQYEKEIKGSTPQIDQYVAGLKGELDVLNLGNDKLAGSLLKIYAFAMEQMHELNALKAGQNGQAVVQQVQRNAGPTASVVNNGGTTKGLQPDDAPFDPSMWPASR